MTVLQPLVRIREAAALLSVSPSTLRVYEQRGVIPSPARTVGGQRVYSWADLEQVRAVLVSARGKRD